MIDLVVAVGGVALVVAVALVLFRQRSVGRALEEDMGPGGEPVVDRPAGPGAEATGVDPGGGSTTAPDARAAERPSPDGRTRDDRR
jgi:hypothetical protein